ncbi:MAG: hypothetical protein JXR37_06480 [Kiritimatiellae bacterium]|nr:hypothetical protein [Kiritimatiellia bacterium]
MTAGAAVLILLALGGILHGARAGSAQALRRRAATRHLPSAVLALCQRAHRLYAYDYYGCVLAAWTAYDAAQGDTADGPEKATGGGNLEQAELWCDRGLALNPYQRKLNRLKAHLLLRQDPEAAVRHWRRYVEWAFWQPDHHAFLAMLLARAGEFAQAERALDWAGGSRYHDLARKVVDEAKRDMSALLPKDTP